jgi:hypothetical protein
MSERDVVIRYDGGDANKNTIEAKLFGQSLQGLDRMVSDCLVIFSQQRLPKRSERAGLILKVHEPKAGSYDLPAIYQEASQILGMGIPILSAIGPDIVSHYVCAILDYFRGKPGAVELAISGMVEMHRNAIEAMSQVQREALQNMREVESDRHTEMLGMQDILRLAIMGSGKAAVDYVAPIGKSVDTATFASGQRSITTDKTEADAIRDSQKLDWTPLANEVLTTDGFKFHSNGLSIENPERDGFMMAEVNDPVFFDESNPYTQAASRRAKIEVLARKGYKNGALAKVQIVNFVRDVA